MTLTLISAETVSFDDEQPQLFPWFNVTPGNGAVIVFKPLPPGLSLPWGSFVLVAALRAGGETIEIPSNEIWYPKGVNFGTVIPILSGLPPAGTELRVGLLARERYPGTTQPREYDIELYYDDALPQSVGFGL